MCLFLFVWFCFYHLSWGLLICLFSSPLLSFILFAMPWACGVLVPWPGVGSDSLVGEHPVEDVGPPGNSRHTGNIKQQELPDVSISTPRPGSTQLHAGSSVTHLCQPTSKTGTQTHPSADWLPKVVLSSLTPQNTPLDDSSPSERQDPAPPTRVQTPVPPTRKPT